MTPTISTPNLVLRPLKKATVRQVRWLNDPDVVRYSEQRHQTHSLITQLRYIDLFVGGSHIWGIYRVADDEHVGNIAACHDEPNNVTDLGIMIGETACWHKGIGLEAWKSVCTWLLDPQCGAVRKIEAGAMKANEAMIKILRGSSFNLEGERANHFLLDGGAVGMVLYGRTR